MISIKDLEINIKGFKKKYSNFNVSEGDVLMITGKNGSGKTILLNTICGLVNYTKGLIKIKNEDSKLELWKDYTGVFIDRNFLIPYLKPYEYFEICMVLNGINRDENELIKLYSEALFFSDFNKQIKNLSIGNQKKVGIISTLITKPKLLLWDEPFASLDKKTCKNLNDILIDLSNSRVTILYTNHPNQKTYYNQIYELKNE